MSIPELVRAPVVVVRFPVEWCRLVPVLVLATPLVAPFSGDVTASFLLVDCPIFVVETELKTIEQ